MHTYTDTDMDIDTDTNAEAETDTDTATNRQAVCKVISLNFIWLPAKAPEALTTTATLTKTQTNAHICRHTDTLCVAHTV